MKKLQYVIFDMDGLMFDTERLCMIVMKEIYQKHGYTLTDDIYLELIGTNGQVSKQYLQKHFGKDYPHELLTKETETALLDRIEKAGLPIKKGLRRLLDTLQKADIPCAIASSTNHSQIEAYLTKAGLRQYFRFIVGGDEVPRTKPYPDIFLKALAKAQVPAEHALVLEDSHNGILASHAAGIPVICVPDMKKHDKAINDLCLAILPSLDEVADFIQKDA